MDAEELRTLLLDTADELNRLRGVVTDAGQLRHEVERVFDPTALVLWRELKAGVLGPEWIPYLGVPIKVRPGDGVWLWQNFFWPFLRSKVPAHATNAGANNLPPFKRDAQGRVLGTDGKPIPFERDSKGRWLDAEGQPVDWEKRKDIDVATEWDGATPEEAIHIFRQRYGDWADVLKQVASRLLTQALDPSPHSTERIEWSKPVTKKSLRTDLNISQNTLRDRLVNGAKPVAGKYRFRAPSSKSRKIEVALNDLPANLQAKLRPKA